MDSRKARCAFSADCPRPRIPQNHQSLRDWESGALTGFFCSPLTRNDILNELRRYEVDGRLGPFGCRFPVAVASTVPANGC